MFCKIGPILFLYWLDNIDTHNIKQHANNIGPIYACLLGTYRKKRPVYAVSAPDRLRGKSGEGEFILYSILQKHLF